MHVSRYQQPELPFQKHSDESVEAACSMQDRAPTDRQRVYMALLMVWPNGLSDEELQVRLKMNPSTQRPRRIELLKMGLVRKGEQQTKTSSGRSAATWVACTKEGAKP